MDDNFYITYARSYPDTIIPYVEKNNIPLMTSAMNRYSTTTGKFKEMNEYNTPRVVDSGGFTAMEKFGEYPWTVEQYHEWLSNNSDKFDWVVVMDLACEEKFDHKLTKRERMEKTIENTVKHFELDPDYELIPVLQGRSASDYIWSYNKLKENDIPVENVGLGTVCRISSSFKLVDLEAKLRRHCPDIENIHGFGVKFTAFSCGATFESADSFAWSYPTKFGEVWVWDESGQKITTINTDNMSKENKLYTSLVNYHKYVNKIKERQRPVTRSLGFSHKLPMDR